MTTTEAKKKSVLDKATSHYRQQMSGSMSEVEVPEWDTTIYFRSITTLRQEQEVVELTRKGKTVEALVVSIINKAMDKEGNPMFNKMDKVTLMNEVDPNVILRVANAINGPSLPSVQDLEGN